MDPAVHEMVFSQVDPRDGVTTLGRGAGEGHGGEAGGSGRPSWPACWPPSRTRPRPAGTSWSGRRRRCTGRRAPYTDLTVVYSKSVSVVHASIRENARRAALAGDLAGEAWWADVQARYAGILFDAAVAGMRHLDRWAVTRVWHGPPGR